MILTRILLVLFFGLCSLSGYAEEKPLFGYVDVSQAVMFHPMMASFKVKEGRFSPTVLKTATPDRDQVRKQLQKKRDTLQTRISDLEKQLRGIDQDYKVKLEALAPLKEKLNQYRKEPPVSLLEEYNTRKGTIDRKYWQQRETVTLQIQQANQEMQDTLREPEEVNLAEYGVQLSRSFRALKVWLSLKTFGRAAFAQAIEHGFDLADYAAEQIARMDGWNVVSAPSMAILAFRHTSSDRPDDTNRRLADALRETGVAMVSTTVLRGETVLRLCLINPRTKREDIDVTLSTLDRLAREMR